jgi:hypothetical protein
MIYVSNLYSLLDVSRGTIEVGLLVLALLLLVDWHVSKPRYGIVPSQAALLQNKSEQPMRVFNRAA